MTKKISLLAALVAVGLAACQPASAVDQPAAAAEAAVAVTTQRSTATTVPERLDLDGTLEARRRARVAPRTSGHVAAVDVERGSVVKTGDPLVRLRSEDFELAARAAQARVKAQREQLGGRAGADAVPEVAAARLDWESARDYLARVRPLHEKGVMDDLSFEQAERREAVTRAMHQAARQRAQAGFAQLQALSAEADIRAGDAEKANVAAPFDGVVVARFVEVGEFVGPQNAVVELVDPAELKLILEVPERAAGRVAIGQRAEITVDGVEGTLPGEVRFVAGALDASRRTLTIEVYAQNPDQHVRPGHFARARIELGAGRPGVEVPAAALVERAGVHRVYVVRGGRAAAEIVRVLERRGDRAVVEGGVAAGDAVVVDPPRTLADDSPVQEGKP